MMPNLFGPMIAGALLAVLAVQANAQPKVWVADPMTKVFREDEPPANPPAGITIHAARGEYESAQVCLRTTAAVRQVQVVASDLQGKAGTIPAAAVTWNPVGYVPLAKNTSDTPAAELCCKAPVEVPDPLLPPAPVDVEAGRTQPLWITVHVPREAAAGGYTGKLTVRWEGGEAEVPLALTVWPFAIPETQHLSFTNWISPEALAKYYKVAVYSDAFFGILGRYARACAEHHQNILWIGLGVVGITQQADGTFAYDWGTFDRWVEVVSANGCGRSIEIQQLGGWKDGNWDNSEIVLHGYGVKLPSGETKTLPAEEVLPKLLPALEAHLQARGWMGKTLIHIADEPAVHHVASYAKVSDWVHSLAPHLRRIDAIEAPDFTGHLEVWVPKLNHLYNWLPHYEKARDGGAEIWFYTCCHPMGAFPNRFLDFPLIKTRILQWYNWRFGLSGYLHWGLNFWDDDPLHSTGNPQLPPGDSWIVYPGPDGPLSSIRWEALRDGFEDYEYLWLLADRSRQVAHDLGVPAEAFPPGQRSDELAHRLVRTMIDYAHDPAALRAVREEIAAEIMQLDASPREVAAVDPPTWHQLAQGPIVVETKVWAEDGAEVTVNGAATHRQPDGSWAQHTFLGQPTSEVKIEVRKAGATKMIVRRYAG
jgi:hypothetical protein